MTKEDVIPVDIKREIHAKLAALAKIQNTSIRKYTNTVLLAHVSTVPHYQKKFARIEVVGPTETGVLVNDKNQDKIAKVDIDLKDGSLHCSLDKKDFCEHIFVSLLSPHWATFFQNHLSTPS